VVVVLFSFGPEQRCKEGKRINKNIFTERLEKNIKKIFYLFKNP
jgi:hypothetical protein